MSALLGFASLPEFNYSHLKFLLDNIEPDPDALWQQLNLRVLLAAGLKPMAAERACAARQGFDLAAYSKEVKRLGLKVLEVCSAEYPALLKEVYNPPLVLYQRGELDLAKISGLAIVGTREPTPYGKEATTKFVDALQGSGLTVVSGLARGIDALAHQGALKNGLSTVAVLGTGVDQIYPAEHKSLYQQIIKEGGAILSESALSRRPERWHFPRRNRIVTGLSRATVVIEGKLSSGALISGKLAMQQNRDLYALPGPVFSELSAGPNWLIEQGATILRSPELLVTALCGEQRPLFHEQPPHLLLTDLEQKVRNALPNNQTLTLDQLIELTGLQPASLTNLLLNLELKGVLTKLHGRYLAIS